MKGDNVIFKFFYFTTAKFLCFTLYYQTFPSVSVDSPEINYEPTTTLVLAWRGQGKSQKKFPPDPNTETKITILQGKLQLLRVKMRSYREFLSQL